MKQISKTMTGARNLLPGAWNFPAGAWNLPSEMVHFREPLPQVLHAPGARMTVVKQTPSHELLLSELLRLVALSYY